MTDEHSTSRRSFLRTGTIASTALVTGASGAIAQQIAASDASNLPATAGDIAILRFLAAAEILETDLWQQYNELGGIQDSEVPGGTGSAAYTAALKVLDGDMDQYIHDNTEDEFTHQDFHQRLAGFEGRAARQSGAVSHFARQSGDGGRENKKTPHQSHAAQSRYQLVDAVS